MLALVGLPLVGKSTVGRLLASQLKRPFIDLDVAIEQHIACSIKDFFDTRGEAEFRDIESELIERLSRLDRCILSTGGGSVLREENRRILRVRGTVIYLHARPEQLYARMKNSSKRPLLLVENPQERMQQLYLARDALYRETAHYVIPTGGRPSKVVVRTILNDLNGYRTHSG